MKLDFSVAHLANPQSQCAGINTALIDFIKQQQRTAGLSNLQLIKCMGLSNTNKALRRLNGFEQTGHLPNSYFERFSDIFNFDITEIYKIQTQHRNQKFAELTLFINNFELIWSYRHSIIRKPDYANISFTGVYLSVAFLSAASYNIGILLQHYINGDWSADNVCCDRVYIIGAGGSPLSGNNTCHGFCRRCLRQRNFKVPAFGSLLEAHKKLQPACPQRVTSKTITDLLKVYP